jgi:hypothetical protein
MGWANCGTDSKGRGIGYAHPAMCDHPGCKTKIDRGLTYACGGMHGLHNVLGGDEHIDWSAMYISCEGYFCEKHRTHATLEHKDGADLWGPELCLSCAASLDDAYRNDPEMREIWPTKSPPIPCDSNRQAQPRDGTARPVGCQSGHDVASPNPANLPSSGDSE